MITMFLRKIGFKAITTKLAAAEKQIAEMGAEQRTVVSDYGLEREADYKVENGIAHIGVSGLLLTKADPYLGYFGIENTGYDEIAEGIAKAEADSTVVSARFNVNTPGGSVDGLDAVSEMVAKMTKPTTAIVHGAADSAGYYFASQADEILAVSKGSEVGSIGVVVSTYDDTEFLESNGIKKITITNSASTDKRPDLSTEEGRDLLQAHLDDVYELFEERIIEGRSGSEKFNIENVRALKGGVVMARKAIELGLIDGMVGGDVIKNGSTTTNEEEGADMSFDYSKLCEAHPELSAHVEGLVSAAKTDATATATTAERERVAGCLTVAGLAVPELAQKAIDDGQSDGELAKAMIANNKPQASNEDEIPTSSAADKIIGGDEKSEKAAKALDAELDAFYGGK